MSNFEGRIGPEFSGDPFQRMREGLRALATVSPDVVNDILRRLKDAKDHTSKVAFEFDLLGIGSDVQSIIENAVAEWRTKDGRCTGCGVESAQSHSPLCYSCENYPDRRP